MSTIALSKRRVAKNAVSQIAAFGLSGATKAIAAVLVARWLGPQGFGVFTLAWTVASMASFFAPLGLDYRLIRELNRASGREDIETSLPPAILSSLFLGVAIAMGPMVVGAGHEVTGSFLAVAPFVVLSAPVLILRSAFHARERMELETVALGVEGLAGLGAVAVALAGGGGIAAALMGLTIGRAANLIVSLVLYKRLFGRIRMRWMPSEWPALLKVSVPMGFSYIFHTLMLRFDVVMLAMMRSPQQVGLYSAATIIVMTVPIVTAAFSSSLYPVLSRAEGASDPELRKVFGAIWRSLLVVGIVAAAGLTLLAGPIVEVFYGDAFGPSVWIISMLAWILPLRFVNNLSGMVLNATDKQGGRTVAVGAAAIFNIIVNLAFIPLWGYRGAVISTLLTELLLTAMLRKVLRPLSPSFLRPCLEGLALAAVVGVTVSFTPGSVFLRAGTGVAMFMGAAALALWGRRIFALRVKEIQA